MSVLDFYIGYITAITDYPYLDREAIATLPGGKQFIELKCRNIHTSAPDMKVYRDIAKTELCEQVTKLEHYYPVVITKINMTGKVTAKLLDNTCDKYFAEKLDDLALQCFIYGDDHILDVAAKFEGGVLL